jgi:hypothetical protein
MEGYIIAVRFCFLCFYIFLLILARQRETENVIMLRAKRETASQELEALVRQHDLWDSGLKPVLRIRVHLIRIRIHHFRLNIDDQTLGKNYSWEKKNVGIKNYNLPIPRPP